MKQGNLADGVLWTLGRGRSWFSHVTLP